MAASSSKKSSASSSLSTEKRGRHREGVYIISYSPCLTFSFVASITLIILRYIITILCCASPLNNSSPVLSPCHCDREANKNGYKYSSSLSRSLLSHFNHPITKWYFFLQRYGRRWRRLQPSPGVLPSQAGEDWKASGHEHGYRPVTSAWRPKRVWRWADECGEADHFRRFCFV